MTGLVVLVVFGCRSIELVIIVMVVVVVRLGAPQWGVGVVVVLVIG